MRGHILNEKLIQVENGRKLKQCLCHPRTLPQNDPTCIYFFQKTGSFRIYYSGDTLTGMTSTTH